jgi:coenzyme F420-0:L-glutamate ligase/coenzyme F420-1:gamma-L-glutamate ligase
MPVKMMPLRTTHIIQPNEDLFTTICETMVANHQEFHERAILVMAETLVSTTEGGIINITTITHISKQAKKYAQKFGINPQFTELILQEADRIVGGIPGMLLTEKNSILIANAGIDKSNAGTEEFYALWPKDPFGTARTIVQRVKSTFHLKEFGAIITDSRVQPLRRGVIGVAIGADGFYPVQDCRGRKDLYGYKMRWKQRALGDQLADAAHLVMGECDEQTPFVLIEDAPVEFTDLPLEKDSMLFPRDQDLFKQIYHF